MRPAALVSLAVTVWVPWAKPVGVNDQTPLALAVVVPSTVAPSLKRHRGIGIGGAGQRIVGGDVVGRRCHAPAPSVTVGATVS